MDAVTIEAWSMSAAGASLAADLADMDAIFFQSSGTQSFASPEARAAFRQRWLGRYLEAPDDERFVARAGTPRQGHGGPRAAIVGYVVGALGDPARDRRFDDIAYFQDLSALTRRYPAHLHINCAADWRSRGVGAGLIEAFCTEARRRGAPGVHVVTGAGARNAAFYARNGFLERGSAQANGKPVLFLARDLA